MNTAETLRLALQHHQGGRLPEAEKLYRQVLAVEPRQADALHFLGVIAYQAGRPEDAVRMIGESIAILPGNPAAHLNLGNALRNHGLPEEAAAAYRRAIALRPDLLAAHRCLGDLMLSRGRSADAVASYRQALLLAPDTGEIHSNLCSALQDLGRYDEAIAAGREAVRLRPASEMAHNNLGNALRYGGELAPAIASLRRALELRPDIAEAWNNLGLALKENGQVGEAAGAFRQAVELRPDVAEYRFMLAGFTGDQSVVSAPESYVRALFDNYANRYDNHLVERLRYRTPELLLAAVTAVAPGRKFDVLDLGCGTGLCGRVFRPMALRMTGVDLAAKMIEKAAARGIYDRLMTTDLMTSMDNDAGSYDLILSSDVFIYVGELAGVFGAVTRSLRPGGLFAFSVEKHDGDGIVLRQSARFAHSLIYLRGLALANGLAEDLVEEVVLRQDGGADIAGWIVVLRKAAQQPAGGGPA